ncbi:MAG: porin [Zavarzinella sp.]
MYTISRLVLCAMLAWSISVQAQSTLLPVQVDPVEPKAPVFPPTSGGNNPFPVLERPPVTPMPIEVTPQPGAIKPIPEQPIVPVLPPVSPKTGDSGKQEMPKESVILPPPTEPKVELPKSPEKSKASEWYDKLKIRGYTQVRSSFPFLTDVTSAQPFHDGDASIGENQNFLIRRARLIFYGDLSEHISFYFQPDFAATVPGSLDSNEYAQLRDLYADVYLTQDKVHRFRVGQSKVPYGWENLQSSSNRLAFDRNDAFNSATKNERDIGVFYYWTPEYAQEIFKFVSSGLKGSGNYGVFGIGIYNGQGGALQEQNDNLHIVTRLQIPYRFDNGQIVEAGIQAYTGKYTVLSSSIRALGVGPSIRPEGTLERSNRAGLRDERVGGTFIVYPQPLGFQAEWNVGRGPALSDDQRRVEVRSLTGGYLQTMYMFDVEDCGTWTPFVRWSYFQGGYKSARNAPYSRIDEWDLGVEWQYSKWLEFTTMYTITDRTNTRAIDTPGVVPYGQYQGHILRFQLQFNY